MNIFTWVNDMLYGFNSTGGSASIGLNSASSKYPPTDPVSVKEGELVTIFGSINPNGELKQDAFGTFEYLKARDDADKSRFPYIGVSGQYMIGLQMLKDAEQDPDLLLVKVEPNATRDQQRKELQKKIDFLRQKYGYGDEPYGMGFMAVAFIDPQPELAHPQLVFKITGFGTHEFPKIPDAIDNVIFLNFVSPNGELLECFMAGIVRGQEPGKGRFATCGGLKGVIKDPLTGVSRVQTSSEAAVLEGKQELKVDMREVLFGDIRNPETKELAGRVTVNTDHGKKSYPYVSRMVQTLSTSPELISKGGEQIDGNGRNVKRVNNTDVWATNITIVVENPGEIPSRDVIAKNFHPKAVVDGEKNDVRSACIVSMTDIFKGSSTPEEAATKAKARAVALKIGVIHQANVIAVAVKDSFDLRRKGLLFGFLK